MRRAARGLGLALLRLTWEHERAVVSWVDPSGVVRLPEHVAEDLAGEGVVFLPTEAGTWELLTNAQAVERWGGK